MRREVGQRGVKESEYKVPTFVLECVSKLDIQT